MIKYKSELKRSVLKTFYLQISPIDVKIRWLGIVVAPASEGCGSLQGLKRETCLSHCDQI